MCFLRGRLSTILDTLTTVSVPTLTIVATFLIDSPSCKRFMIWNRFFNILISEGANSCLKILSGIWDIFTCLPAGRSLLGLLMYGYTHHTLPLKTCRMISSMAGSSMVKSATGNLSRSLLTLFAASSYGTSKTTCNPLNSLI